MLELFHNDMSVCAQKVRLVLAYKDLKWDGTNLNLRAGEQFAPDFLKINPKGVVPVLLHDKKVITESTVIIEYLEEVFPELSLMSADPVVKAQVRQWLIRLDAGLHDNVAVISFCIAFRHQLLERYPTEESLQEFVKKIIDPSRRAFMSDVLVNGMNSPRLYLAVYAYDKLIKNIAKTLETNDYLVGNSVTLADFSFLPYLERLEQLQLSAWWYDYPQVEAWMSKLRNTHAYDTGMKEWHQPAYIKLMQSFGDNAWEKLSKTLPV